MIGPITRQARRLDEWLNSKLGRPYALLLSVGLGIEIFRRLTELPERVASVHRLVGLLLVLMLNIALLIHQLGEACRKPAAEEPRAPPPA